MAETEQSLTHVLVSLDIHDSPASAGAADAFLDVLPYLGRTLRLQGLACLADTCRQLARECIKCRPL
jgi:hypothetical protein